MLNIHKLLEKLTSVSSQLFVAKEQELDLVKRVLAVVGNNPDLCQTLQSYNPGALLSWWSGPLTKTYTISCLEDSYATLAVDGSQIYYDKHQSFFCYLINVGGIALYYKQGEPRVTFFSEPYVFIESCGTLRKKVDAVREEYELEAGYAQVATMLCRVRKENVLYLFDGSLIFFQFDLSVQEEQETVLSYLTQLDKIAVLGVAMVGYISAPRSTELVAILVQAGLQTALLSLPESKQLEGLVDTDLVKLFLSAGQRTSLFKSSALVTALYGASIKPYFCYLHVGKEIVRLEMPAWIAQDEALVDQVCGRVLDQAYKGNGYPVALFEAHEQAVIKAHEREMFYAMLASMSQSRNVSYKVSEKQTKKNNPLV